jgi:hypothetical protein
MQKQHMTLCYEYNNVVYLEEANAQYETIHYWWYSLGVDDQARFHELENWFNFWHFHDKQWG